MGSTLVGVLLVLLAVACLAAVIVTAMMGFGTVALAIGLTSAGGFAARMA
ncbi:hypothetical protein [Mycolicibacterium sp. CH28]|nr:hypothetical protein [Mycolicibacterium sp. CH28]